MYPRPQAGAEIKVTQIKLENLGWQPPEPQRYGEMAVPSQPITIDHEGRILIGFTVREREELATRQRPGFSYHILRFTPDRKVDLSLAVPTNNIHDNGVYLDQADDVIVRANDILQMLRKGDEPRDGKYNDWESLSACGPRCSIAQSFSRDTLQVLNPDTNPPIAILQGVPPHLVKSCQRYPSDSNPRLTDVFAYWQEGGAWPTPPPVLYRWPLCDYEHRSEVRISSGVFGSIFPLNDQSVVVSGAERIEQKESSRAMIGIISTDGSAKFRVQLPAHDQPENWVQGDERGDRFVISIATWHGGSRWLDISGKRVARRIVVYETGTGKEGGSFAVTPHALIDLAMSPDGHRVAVLSNDTVTIADIP